MINLNKLSFVNSLSFGVALIDSKMNIKFANKIFMELTNCSKDCLEKKSIYDFFPEISKLDLINNNEFLNINTEFDKTLLLDLFKTELFSETLFLLICNDIAKHKQLSTQYNAIIKDKLIYNEILNGIYDGIFITDNNGILQFVNDAFIKLSGTKRKDIINKSIYELAGLNLSSDSITIKVLKTKEPTTAIVDYYFGKKCLVSSTPVFLNNNLIRVVSIIRDITELIYLKDKLLNAASLNQSYMNKLKEFELKQSQTIITNIRSEIMIRIIDKIIKVSPLDIPVLLLGETGVGKDFIANFIHKTSEKEGHFVKVNCGAIPEQLLESELFGYEPGAFTGAQKQGKAGLFELANNGTLYLDEIGDLPLKLQVKLLSAIQDKKIYRLGGTKSINLNTRIIAATNVDIEKLIKNGDFRSDLYYRLNVVEITIPPLRERKDDIMPIAIHFLKEFNEKYKKSCHFSPQIIEHFFSYKWPGNIREMRNTIERMIIFSDSTSINSKNFKSNIISNSSMQENLENVNDSELFTMGLSLKQIINKYEASVIENALNSFDTLKTTSKALKIDISTLLRKKKKYNIK